MKTKIAVTTVSFSKDEELMRDLTSRPGFEVHKNPYGRRLDFDELVDLLSGCSGAIVGLDQINAKLLEACPDLKVISKYGVGLDNVNLVDCEKAGVQVVYTKGVNKRSVAEMALGFSLMLLRNLYLTSNQLSTGQWNKNGGVQLSEKTFGIIGFGNIGQDLARLLSPFSCRILANDIEDRSEIARELGVEMVSKEEIYRNCQVISIHTPLTDLTRDLLNSKTISQMAPGVILLNTARGGIINEKDLKGALQDAHVGGAGLDAYVQEPPVDLELLALPNLICTPHIGGNAREAVLAMGKAAIENLLAKLS